MKSVCAFIAISRERLAGCTCIVPDIKPPNERGRPKPPPIASDYVRDHAGPLWSDPQRPPNHIQAGASLASADDVLPCHQHRNAVQFMTRRFSVRQNF